MADDRIKLHPPSMVLASLAFKLLAQLRGEPPQDDAVYAQEAIQFLIAVETERESAEERMQVIVDQYVRGSQSPVRARRKTDVCPHGVPLYLGNACEECLKVKLETERCQHGNPLSRSCEQCRIEGTRVQQVK